MEIKLGRVLKPQGIRGELKVEPLTKPEFFKYIEQVRINNKDCKIVSASIREGYVFLKLNVCNDRNTAETLRDAIITAEKETLPDLEDNEYFYDDLVGCQVYLDNGEFVGEIVDIENYGNADIFNIHKGLNTVLCPYVDKVFKEIDIHNKKIIADTQRYKEVTEYEDWYSHTFS